MPPELPLIGLDSLHAIACNAPADAARVSVIADAQRGQLYVAEFVRDAGWPAGDRPGVSDRAPGRLAGSTRARDGRARARRSTRPASEAPSPPGSSFVIPRSIIPTATA